MDIDRLRTELAPDLDVRRLIGRGAMADVFLAHEPALDRLVAVKVLAADETARRRFEREARAPVSLSDPHVVPVYRFGRLQDGVPYLVMRFVKGRTVADRLLATGPFEPAEARRLLAQVAGGLAAAHRQGFVHRDVRPGNVLLDEETGTAQLADFGIAAVLLTADPGATQLTRMGQVLGSPRYASPEQLSGKPVAERAHVYSLAVLGYEMFTGRGPYDGQTDRAMIRAHLTEEPVQLARLLPSVDPDLAELLGRCLAKSPAHRPDVVEVANALTHVPSGSSPGTDDALAGMLRRRVPQYVLAGAAAGWVLLQIVDQLVRQNIFPAAFYPQTLNLVGWGVIAVAVASWFDGRKGRQRVTPMEIWVLAILVILWVAVSVVLLVTGVQ
ncbi:MAG TPA: serine/threonine-protein kinase [Longimicrobiales bacterium]|nr:serine/threonine-protein kinase [Longimicrobiales bacterium]